MPRLLPVNGQECKAIVERQYTTRVVGECSRTRQVLELNGQLRYGYLTPSLVGVRAQIDIFEEYVPNLRGDVSIDGFYGTPIETHEPLRGWADKADADA